MKIQIDKIFVTKRSKAKIIDYDKTSKERPAWVRIKNLPKETWFVNIAVGNKYKRYHSYELWNIVTDVFVPVDFSFGASQSYYDKFAKIYDRLVKRYPKNIEAGKFMLNFLEKIQKIKI